MPLEIIAIEDDSDCETCTRRNAEDWDMLQAVKCDATLPGVTCPECGREVSILTEHVIPTKATP